MVNAPRHVYRADKVRVQATIAGAATEATRTARVPAPRRQGGRRPSGFQSAANGRASVEFIPDGLAHGFNRGEVRIELRDALAQDNSFPFAIERKEAGRVLFAGDPRSALYYRSALESVPGFGARGRAGECGPVANLDLEKFALVVLTSPPPASDNLAKYLAGGGGLLVALGPASVAQGRVPVSGERILDSRYAPREGDRFQTAASVD